MKQRRNEQASEVPARAYDVVFLCAYVANGLLMVGVSMLFRYSDFVELHGGSEWELGLIVGVGTIGAIAIRILQGVGIDQIGAKWIWIASLIAYTSGILLHLTIDSVHSPVVYLVRILMQCGLAGTFGASITFVSLRAPRQRTTEVLGIHGTSGFIGMAIGPFVGDMIFSNQGVTHTSVDQLMLGSAIACCAALLFAVLATRGKIHRIPSRRIPAPALLKRYNPGIILLVAAVMGIGLSLPGVFVRPFAASLDIDQIRWFFIAYNVVAFTVRVSTRKLPRLLGERKMILLGISCLAISMPTYLIVREPWQMILPAIVTGLGHAFLFPAVVASGGFCFPPRYRGLATTVILGMFDLGNLIGQPMLGGIVTGAREVGIAPYPTMFLFAGTIFATTGVVYAIFSRERPPVTGNGNKRRRSFRDD